MSSSANISDEIFVYIASDYNDNGVFRTSLLVNSSSYNDTQEGVVVVDNFVVSKTFEFTLNILYEGWQSVFELFVESNQNESQDVSWKVETDGDVIESNNSISLIDKLLTYVWHNYSSTGRYRVDATVNSSNYTSTKTRWVLVQ